MRRKKEELDKIFLSKNKERDYVWGKNSKGI